MRRSIGRSLAAVLMATGALVIGVISPTSAATCQSWGTQPPSPGINQQRPARRDGAQRLQRVGGGHEIGYVARHPDVDRALERHGMDGRAEPQSERCRQRTLRRRCELAEATSGPSATPPTEPLPAPDRALQRAGMAVVRVPHAGTGGGLVGVVAFGKKDAWAVGSTTLASGGTRELIEHWNGHAWKIQASPNVGTQNGFVGGIDGSSPKDIWVVGSRGRFGESASTTLIEHWNGTVWKVVKAPNGSDFENQLSAVSVVSLIRCMGGRLLRCLRQTVAHVAGTLERPRLEEGREPEPRLDREHRERADDDVADQRLGRRHLPVGSGGVQDPRRTLERSSLGRRTQREPADLRTASSAVGADANDDAWAVGHVADVVWQALALHCC